MTIIYTWDEITQAYESMREQMRDAKSENQRGFLYLAIGMLTLIPQIRNFPEFSNFDFHMSLGKLMCISKSNGAKLYLSAENDRYFVETYDEQSGHSGVKEFNARQIVSALRHLLKEVADRST